MFLNMKMSRMSRLSGCQSGCQSGSWSGCRLGPILACAAVALLTLGACGRSFFSPAPPYRPNVLVILVDALRADVLGVAGYPMLTTPSIDRLASEGVVFDAAFAHSTWTKPSIATLFTSLYPSQHGLHRVASQSDDQFTTEILAERFHTLAEHYRAAGYSTIAVINQVHLKERFGFAQGFDHFQAVRDVGAFRLNHRLLSQLQEGTGSPFFAYLHYLDVHWPYTKSPQASADRFGAVQMSREPPHRGNRVAEWARDLDKGADLAALRARYDREVAFADAAIGELMAALEEMNLYEDTIVVVTSDHGEGFLEHGKLLHGYAPYEEVLRVPLVLRLPEKLRPGVNRVEQPVGLIDLMPTLLELTGSSPPAQATGRSRAALLDGPQPGAGWIFAETSEAVAARGSRYKLLRFSDGRSEFYDLQADPLEQEPLEGPCVDACAELERRLSGFMMAMEKARAAQSSATAALEAEELEDLKSLGYL
jgi:arylsulfatase A-like enzyme